MVDMALIQYILSYTLLLNLFSPSLCTEHQKEAQVDHETFQKLLAQVDAPALHAALHDFSPKKYIHGVFPEDRTAVEAIHIEEPGLATGIVKMAKLVKRQNNGTVTATTTPPDVTVTPSTPVPVGPGVSSSAAGESPSPGPSSSVVEVSSSVGAAITTSGPVSTDASFSSSFTPGQVITTTDSQGRTIVTTIGGAVVTLSPSPTSSPGRQRSSITSIIVQTSTLPNGEQSTITAVTVVGAGGEEGTATAKVGASGASGGQPGLQTGEAVMTRGCGREMALVLGAAVGVAFML